MEAVVYSIEGKDTGKKINLPDEVFAAPVNKRVVHLDILRYLAAQRQGTHKTKQRAEISGSTRKIKKQKGTGTARAGSIKSPLFKGGGTIFGPQPRSYDKKINKKEVKLSRVSALSDKAKNNKIIVIEDFTFDAPKTKGIISIIDSFKLNDRKKLFVLEKPDNNVYLSSKNLQDTKVVVSKDLNTYSLVHSNVLFITEGAIGGLKEILA